MAESEKKCNRVLPLLIGIGTGVAVVVLTRPTEAAPEVPTVELQDIVWS